MAKSTDIEGRERPASIHYPAKVTRPARRPSILHRQRLTDLLAEHTSRRVTVVSAPAGYGKTTLLLDFDQSWQAPICWYSLDERDRDLRTFQTDLAVAERVAGLLPADAVLVAESGVSTKDGAARMAAAGFDAILVGEALVTAADPVHLLQDLRGLAL